MKTIDKQKAEVTSPAAATATIVGIGAGTGAPPLGPAPGEGFVWVALDGVRHRARMAVAGSYRPSRGDEVVVIGGAETLFVVGVLTRDRPDALSTEDGSTARLDEDGGLEVRDAQGRLRIRYDGEETSIVATEGDLRLDAPRGAVVVRAATDVTLEADGEIRQRAARIELSAEELFERTRDSIREVSSLLLTRAGRVRSLVREGFTLVSRRTSMRSEKETSIDGQRILLG